MTTPFDPYCERYAADMDDYDTFIVESPEEWEEFKALSIIDKGERREQYVRRNEGTYNRTNGHFACDECYISIGQPVAANGWMAP